MDMVILQIWASIQGTIQSTIIVEMSFKVFWNEQNNYFLDIESRQSKLKIIHVLPRHLCYSKTKENCFKEKENDMR
jgi:hypothetical protein